MNNRSTRSFKIFFPDVLQTVIYCPSRARRDWPFISRVRAQKGLVHRPGWAYFLRLVVNQVTTMT